MKNKLIAILLVFISVLSLASCRVKTEISTPTPIVTETPEVTPTPIKGFNIYFYTFEKVTDPETIKNVTKIPSDLPVLEVEGFTFEGWFYDFNLSKPVQAGDELKDNVTLFAKWTGVVVVPTTYSVTYNVNGHGTVPSVVEGVTSLPAELPTLTAEGWTFVGWYTDEALTTQAVAGATITANTTLYAKWEEVQAEPELPNTTHTIAQALASADDTVVEVSGTVIAVNSKGFILKDSTGMITIFSNSVTHSLVIGDVAKVNGKIATYSNAKQIDPTAINKVSSGTFTQPTPTEITNADSFMSAQSSAPVIQYVKFTGKYEPSSDGKYHNVKIDGATTIGSLTYASQNLTGYANQNVVVEGWFVYITGSTSKYINIILVNISLADGSDEPNVPDQPTEEPNEPEVPSSNEITIAEFLSKKDTVNYFTLTGTVSNITNTTYGNFDLVDSTGTIYVYGLLPSKGSSDKTNFASLNVTEGCVIKISGVYLDYNGKDEVSNAYLVEIVSSNNGGSSNPINPDTPVVDELKNVVFESVEEVYVVGKTYSITATNVPTGLTVEYEGNNVTGSGNHLVTAKFYDSENNLAGTLYAYINVVYQVEFPEI